MGLTLDLPTTRALLRRIVEAVYAEVADRNDGVDPYLLVDEVTDTYAVWFIGWDVTGRVLGPSVYLRIKNGKVYIEEDKTEEGVSTQITESGIPPSLIVFGYQHPDERVFFDFAIA